MITKNGYAVNLYAVEVGARGIIPAKSLYNLLKDLVPPLLEQPTLKPVTGGTLTWVQAGTRLPPGAIIGGYEKEPLFIMRAPHVGSLTPGKYVPSERVGYVGWSWEAHRKVEFEILCGFDYAWVPSCDDKVPLGAVLGGTSENRFNERLYVGRALHNGHIIPGKVQRSHRVCFIAFEGKEIAKRDYEILVVPTINPSSVNKTFVSGNIPSMNDTHSSEPEQEEYDPVEGWEDAGDDYPVDYAF